jgi:transposase-like protein
MCKVKDLTSFRTLMDVSNHFSNEQTCLDYLEQWGWKGNAYCRKCHSKKLYKCDSGKLFKCSECPNSFSIKTGTIFENSKLPLQKWFMAMYLLANNKKGISSRQLAGYIGVTQKTSWMMMHKIREAMPQATEKMKGVVAMDECFVGGKNKNRHIDKKVQNKPDRTFKDKHSVHGFMDGEGQLRCFAIKDCKQKTLLPSVRRNVEAGSVIITDELHAYKELDKSWGGEYEQLMVNHSARKFLSAEGATTNTVENAWSHLKRMFHGTYNMVTFRHLQKYLNEYVYRFNSRDTSHEERFRCIFDSIHNPITYKMLINGKEKRKPETKERKGKNNRSGESGGDDAFFYFRPEA